MFKTAIATAILGLGVAGAYFAIQNPINQPDLSEKSDTSNLPKNSPFVERLTSNSIVSTPTEAYGATLDNSAVNLTDDFINGLKQDITENNLENSTNNLVVSDPEQITKNLLSGAMNKFESERLKPVVDDTKIKISNDNSRNSIIAYVNKFESIISETTNRVSVENISEDPDPKDLIPMLAGYDFAIKNFYDIPTPSSVLIFHKREIELLSRKRRALEEIISYQKDPVSSILASQELEYIQNEFDNLAEDFNKFLETI